MGVSTFVMVADPVWRFDAEGTFDALRRDYATSDLRVRGPRRLAAVGWSDSWEVSVDEGGTTFIISAPPQPLMSLVSWVRAFVPVEVELEVFDDQDPEPVRLRPGITPDQVRSEFFPDAWMVEEMTPKEPPSREERARASKPPYLP
ncbi:MAG TPA: hypothetical protein VNJ48_15505 [Nocardioides sp.]|nr:hypothetical protein [Nocardioides sp.]